MRAILFSLFLFSFCISTTAQNNVKLILLEKEITPLGNSNHLSYKFDCYGTFSSQLNNHLNITFGNNPRITNYSYNASTKIYTLICDSGIDINYLEGLIRQFNVIVLELNDYNQQKAKNFQYKINN